MGSDIKYNGHGIFWGIISKYMSRDWRQPSELYPVLLSAAEFRAAFPLTELSWRKIRSFLVKLTLLLGTYSSRNTVCVCVRADTWSVLRTNWTLLVSQMTNTKYSPESKLSKIFLSYFVFQKKYEMHSHAKWQKCSRPSPLPSTFYPSSPSSSSSLSSSSSHIFKRLNY